ncbi:beta-galactosidase family protein [Acidicapsa dinghuensis]|uniref:Beta-galactosidase n=1 Tax=Acidicapsa dinghuensis TaxID=2218256 RepID=A0ABW1EFF5_9BACT|nr:beta-galactosidase family protein [Acidicapsa dinghuensis]
MPNVLPSRLRQWILLASCAVVLALTCSPLRAQSNDGRAHTFAVRDGHFELDGKPFQIISGEMHYPRIPREYWRARLRMAKAMGLNAVTTYVFWNVHEPEPGKYDFTGQNDVAEFIREAQQEGLWVLLRPGPYSCAEWEWGGYPYWLLKTPGIVVRSSDPKFMEPAKRWLMRLGKELAPLQLANGGPILTVQVENEYGSFDKDHAYMEQIHHALIDAGFGKSVMYTADGPEEIPNGSLPELPAVINFGTGEAKHGFEVLHKLRPEGPFMSGEYWAGWFDHWGEKHQTTDGAKQAEELGWMLQQGYSVSLYMVHGGTSFGWMNGANWDGKHYQPDVNSYDYDTGIDESGRPRAKYFAFRNAIVKATGLALPVVPSVAAPQAVAPIALTESASLWDNLPQPVISHELKSMEDLGQAYGYILYRTTAHADAKGELAIDGLHDYAQVYVDGKLAGTVDRRLNQSKLDSVAVVKGARIDLLVENSGRINFSKELRGERKGILGSVTVAGTVLHDWRIYPLPLTDVDGWKFSAGGCKAAPCVFRGRFTPGYAGGADADTFLDSAGLTKGFVWLNGRPLGRTWKVGPQETLYVPGVWLKPGANELTVLDLNLTNAPGLPGLDKPILDAPIQE